jgi:LysM repeat protein
VQLLVVAALALALNTSTPAPTATATATPKATTTTATTPTPRASPTTAPQATPAAPTVAPTPTNLPAATLPPTPAPAPLVPLPPVPVAAPGVSILPATRPGLGADEGVFLLTDADDGGKAAYFIAQGARHAILDADIQSELRLNPLWPYRAADRDEVLSFPEGAPIGGAVAGRVGAPRAPVVADEPAPVAAVLTEAPAGVADAEPVTIQVRPGDSIFQISRTYGISERALMDANGITDPNRVYAGQNLVIPGTASSPAPAAPVVAEAPQPDADTPEADAPGQTYTVKKGDTLTGIASRFGLSEDDLLALNGIPNRNRIYAGQVLAIS